MLSGVITGKILSNSQIQNILGKKYLQIVQAFHKMLFLLCFYCSSWMVFQYE